MNESDPLEEMKAQSSKEGKDPATRRILIGLMVLWLLTLAALVAVAWNAYFGQKEKVQTLAEQVAIACRTGALSTTEQKTLCNNAENAIDGGVIVKQGPAGPPGPPGADGVDGTDGTDGKDGAAGRPGKNGVNGDDGKNGLNGQDGSDGANGLPGKEGPQGPAGPEGPQGKDGAPGKDGVDGQPGADGQDAFPFTFTFTIPGVGPLAGTTYVCTVTDPAATTTCQEAA